MRETHRDRRWRRSNGSDARPGLGALGRFTVGRDSGRPPRHRVNSSAPTYAHVLDDVDASSDRRGRRLLHPRGRRRRRPRGAPRTAWASSSARPDSRRNSASRSTARRDEGGRGHRVELLHRRGARGALRRAGRAVLRSRRDHRTAPRQEGRRALGDLDRHRAAHRRRASPRRALHRLVDPTTRHDDRRARAAPTRSTASGFTRFVCPDWSRTRRSSSADRARD